MSDKSVTIYGSSDDLMEFEGKIPGCDEYPGEKGSFVLIGGKAKTRVKLSYDGVWAISAEPVDEDVPMLPLSIEQMDNGYSAKATVEDVEMVIHEADRAK